jgi:transposase
VSGSATDITIETASTPAIMIANALDDASQIITYTHEVLLTPDQYQVFRQAVGNVRLVYNAMLEQRILAYQLTGKSPSWMDQRKEITPLRNLDATDGFAFLNNTHPDCYTYAAQDLDKAYQSFFKGKGGYPSFRRKNRNYGLTFQGKNGDGFKDYGLLINSRIYSKTKKIKLAFKALIGERNKTRLHLAHIPSLGRSVIYNQYYKRLGDKLWQGTLLKVSVKQDSLGRVLIHYTCKIPTPAANPAANSLANPAGNASADIAPNSTQPLDLSKIVALDLGIAISVQASDGASIHFPVLTKEEQKLIAHYQRQLARMQYGSKRSYKKQNLINKIRQRAIKRRDQAQYCSIKALLVKYDIIVIEDLKLANMTKSAKGTVENPGVNVKQKSGLNRSLLSQAHGKYRERLIYTALHCNKQIITIAPHGTSQTCNQCNHKAPENRESQAVFKCVACGYETNADYNGSLNIFNKGIIKLNDEKVTAETGLVDSLMDEKNKNTHQLDQSVRVSNQASAKNNLRPTKKRKP